MILTTTTTKGVTTGLLDKLKDKSRGVLTAAKPEDRVPPASVDEVAERLLAIRGRGIKTSGTGDTVEVLWSAKVICAGVGGGRYEYLYRSIVVDLDPQDHEVVGLCRKTTTEAEVGWEGSFCGSVDWERGQHVGSETSHVLAWLGPAHHRRRS